jgi:hypothetical protein
MADAFNPAIIFDPAYLNEPVPWENQKSTILGVILTATVCKLWEPADRPK